MRLAATIFISSLATVSLSAQTTSNSFCSTSSAVGCTIPNLFGKGGLTLPNPFHQAHFESDFRANFTPLNSAIATELTLLPLASPASGFTYTFDRSAGLYSPTAQSFGPILTERAETIGRGKFYTGVTYQRFRFDKLDGQTLNSLPAVFRHEHHELENQPNGQPAAYEKDYITTNNSLSLKFDQFTLFGTVGLTNTTDISIAIPLLDVRLAGTSYALIHRLAPPTPFGQAHFFNAADPQNSIAKTFNNSSSATGLGDITIRVKQNLFQREGGISVAFLTDVRLPTGDEKNFLGSGAVGLKPFIAVSLGSKRVAPHANFGYQWNGNSVLAGDLDLGTKRRLPSQIFYSAGADVGIAKHLTIAGDFLGQRVFNGPKLGTNTYTAADGSTAPEIAFSNSNVGLNSAALGVKYNPYSKLLISANALFRLDSGGLRQNVVPLVGFSYTF